MMKEKAKEFKIKSIKTITDIRQVLEEIKAKIEWRNALKNEILSIPNVKFQEFAQKHFIFTNSLPFFNDIEYFVTEGNDPNELSRKVIECKDAIQILEKQAKKIKEAWTMDIEYYFIVLKGLFDELLGYFNYDSQKLRIASGQKDMLMKTLSGIEMMLSNLTVLELQIYPDQTNDFMVLFRKLEKQTQIEFIVTNFIPQMVNHPAMNEETANQTLKLMLADEEIILDQNTLLILFNRLKKDTRVDYLKKLFVDLLASEKKIVEQLLSGAKNE